MYICDMHIHSNYSDGSFSPEQICEIAVRKNIAGIAVTDHDTVAGLDFAEKAAKLYNIDFLPGMEITTEYNKRKIHIIALGFDKSSAEFKDFYRELQYVRESRIGEIIEGVRRKGIDISLEKVKRFTPGAVDRYAIVRYLMTLHIDDKAQFLWDRYINPVVAELNLSIDMPVEKVIDGIHKAGGIVSLAHFNKKIGLGGFSRTEQENIICCLKGMGLDALERWYPRFSADDTVFIKEMTKKYDFFNTGGTDFHGRNRPDVELGTGIDNNTVIPYEIFQKVKTKTIRE